MNRYFCDICGKMRRSRSTPPGGICYWHSHESHRAYLLSVRVAGAVAPGTGKRSAKPVPAPAATSARSPRRASKG